MVFRSRKQFYWLYRAELARFTTDFYTTLPRTSSLYIRYFNEKSLRIKFIIYISAFDYLRK